MCRRLVRRASVGVVRGEIVHTMNQWVDDGDGAARGHRGSWSKAGTG
jgi:hypothetical protein